MARTDRAPDAELLEWGLIRVSMNNGVTLHAVGLRVCHPHEESRIVVTSLVRSISDDRRTLETQNSVYDLVREVDRFPSDHCTHHAWLLALKGCRPDRVDWLRPDGSIYRSMSQAEFAKVIEAEATGRGLAGHKLLEREGTIDPDLDLEF